MAFVVVYDACVLCPSTLRDLLIRIHQAGLVQAKWTDEILNEVTSALRRNLPDVDEQKLDRLRTLMVKAVRDCNVTNYEPLIGRRWPRSAGSEPRHVHMCSSRDSPRRSVARTPSAAQRRWHLPSSAAVSCLRHRPPTPYAAYRGAMDSICSITSLMAPGCLSGG